MSERYQRLLTLPENIYAEGSPLIITAGALLKDTVSGKVLLQLKLRSITDKTVKAVYVGAFPLDTSGKPLGEAVEHQYLDLSVDRDGEFGSKNAIFMPDSTTRGVNVRVNRVIYTDNTEWTDNGGDWSPLAFTQNHLAVVLGNSDLVDEYRLKFTDKCELEPIKVRDLWACSCGHINPQSDDACKRCGASLAAMLALDTAALKASCEKRLERERAEAAALAEAEAKKRRKNTVIAAITIPLLIALTVIAVWFVTETMRVESKARSYMAEGDLAAAMEVLIDYNKPDKTAALMNEIGQEMYDKIDKDITYNRFADAMASIKSYKKYIYTTNLLEELQSECKHRYIDGEAVLPTCTEEGHSVHTCEVCEYVLTQYIPANGHSEGEAPTCTKASVCGECGEILEEMLPHNYCVPPEGEYGKAPTCTEEGWYEQVCGDCGHTEKVSVEKIPHDFVSEVTKEATCTAEGVRTNTCRMCQKTETEAIPMIAHDNIEKVTKAATCTAEGTMQTLCRVCGKTEASAPIAKIPHSYHSVTVKAATCTAEGSAQNVCRVCGYKGNTETVAALGHNYSSSTKTQAKCESDGIKVHSCQRCSHSYEETVKAYGHSWKDATCTAPKSCSRCGLTSGSALGHYYASDYSTRYKLLCRRCFAEPDLKLNYTCEGLPATYTKGGSESITVTSAELIPAYAYSDNGNVVVSYKINYTVNVTGRIYNHLNVDIYDTNGSLLTRNQGMISSTERELGPHTNTIYYDDIDYWGGFKATYLPNNGTFVLKFSFKD